MRAVVAAAVVSVVACGRPAGRADDGGLGADAAPRDASQGDALLLDGAVADALVDAPTDAATDAPPDAPPDAMPTPLPEIQPSFMCDLGATGPVTVHTHGVETNLLIHDAGGNLVERTTSGPLGERTLDVPGCGSVTAYAGEVLHTITFVSAGDDLWMWGSPYVNEPLLGPAELLVENIPPSVSGFVYNGTAGGSGSPTGPDARLFYWRPSYLDAQGRMTISVHASAAGRQDPRTYVLLRDIDPEAAITQPVVASAWESAANVVPIDVAVPEAADVRLSLHGMLHTIMFSTTSDGSLLPTTDHALLVDLPAYLTSTWLQAAITTPTGRRAWTSVLPLGPVPALDLDLSGPGALLPELRDVVVVPAPTRPTLKWSFGPPTGLTPDIIWLDLQGPPYTWRVGVPPTLTSYTLPALPPDLAADFSTTGRLEVIAAEASDRDGYGAYRGVFTEAGWRRRVQPIQGIEDRFSMRRSTD